MMGPLLALRGQGLRIDSLQRIVQENKQDQEENKAFNVLASEYTRTDMPMAKAYLYKSVALAKTLNYTRALGIACTQMVVVQMNTGHPDSAKIYLLILEKMAADSSHSFAKNNYYSAAGLFYRIQGNYKAALPFMIRSLDESVAIDKENPSPNNSDAVAGQLLNIGNTYTDMGDYRNSLRYHLKALESFERTGNKKGESFSYQGVGNDFDHLGQYKTALSYMQAAMVLKRELNDKRGIGTTLAGMGTVYKELTRYDSAMVYYLEAMKAFREMKLVPAEAGIYIDIGSMYVLKNDPVNAEAFLSQAKLLAAQIKDSSLSAHADIELIELHTHVNQREQAEKRLMSSLKTSIEMGDKNTELLNYQYLSDHYAAEKQFDKALEYSNKFHNAKDSLQTRDIQVQMKNLEEQYNLERKEKEIALLKKDQLLDQNKLQRQEAFEYGAVLFLVLLLLIGFLIINRYRIVHKGRRLVEMERMRNHIARDLHDDIGSTLTSINILSKMALQQAHGQDGVVVNLQKIKDRTSAIMESMSDIVWAINPQNDTLEKMVFRMKEFTAEILEPLNIHYTFKEEGDLSAIKLDIRKRRDLYLVFKEAVNNAAKYSHCRNLDIRLQQDQQSLHLKVIDDGKGFDQQGVRNGNGLANMRQRATALDGVIRVDTGIGRGTGILLDVPLT
jgi:signal transduction histidine kinase